MPSNRFYLACLRDTVGSNVSFHCKEGKGYSTDIDHAHVYSREDAQKAWNRGREIDLPLCADHVDALSVWHTDCQRLPTDSEMVAGCTRYVVYQKNRWDGNDVYWLSDVGLPTTDFSKASIAEAPGDSVGLVWLPFAKADAIKRRTFNIDHINRRKMIQAAGLITPDHIKRQQKRQRNASGKTRWNCPRCGKISWQFNPYDFDGCRSINCDAWTPSY